tara:strand:+ start:535 stop:957 length:423 start_codon:yes stop_codon:yes gene_type:complete
MIFADVVILIHLENKPNIMLLYYLNLFLKTFYNNIIKMFVKLSRATQKGKKYQATFYDDNRKKIKTIAFGAKGMNDYIIYNRTKGKKFADERKKLYLQRHSGERGGVMTASTLSKMILWNKQSFEASYKSYKSKYNLKKY